MSEYGEQAEALIDAIMRLSDAFRSMGIDEAPIIEMTGREDMSRLRHTFEQFGPWHQYDYGDPNSIQISGVKLRRYEPFK